MKLVYDKFALLLGTKNFILCSGTENAIKNILIAVKPKLFSIENPSWYMPQIIASSLDIDYDLFGYRIQNNKVTPDKPKGDLIYTTHRINNLFTHEQLITNKLQIIDIAYTMDLEFIRNESKRNFIVGSFSKIYGPGVRLAFIVYPEQYHDRMQLLREQYINTAAYNYILSLNEWPQYDDYTKPENSIWSHNTYSVYDSIQSNTSANDYKIFQLDGKTYYRLGIKKDTSY